MILLAKEIPELRDRMAAFSDSPAAPMLMQYHLGLTEPDHVDVVGDDERHQFSRLTAKVDAASFRDADLYFVQRSMVDLLMQAKDGIGDAGFMDYDMPGPVGMAYLDADLMTSSPAANLTDPRYYDNLPDDQKATVDRLRDVAWPERLLVLWRWMPPEPPDYPNGWVRVAWYEDRDYWVAKLETMGAAHEKEVMGLNNGTLYRSLGPYVFDGHQVIACDPEQGGPRTELYHGGDTWRAQRGEMFRALCYLLRQRVAELTTVMPDRAARRRLAREGKEPPPVRVISLRGASTHGGGDGSREYVHRWMVRGHWRRQWYRSIQQHRPVWITPYIKGPEDAPLLGGEKVYTISAPAAAAPATDGGAAS